MYQYSPNLWLENIKYQLCSEERAEIIAGHDGAGGKGVGSTYTFASTLSLEDHYTMESFEVSPLQDDHDVLIPWW